MKRPWKRLSLPALATAAALGLGCGPIDGVERGRQLFSDPRLSVSPSNAFACSTCHAPDPPGASPSAGSAARPSGYTLSGAAARPTFWGGGLLSLLDAVNFCQVEFMRGEKLAGDDTSGLALLAYLRSLTGGPTGAQPLTIVQNIDAAYLASLPAGDGGRGAATYGQACAGCHGEIHTGKGRLGPYVSAIPDDTIATFGSQARAVTAEKMRHGKFFGIGGNMPFYSKEALSDGEVADVLAYLQP